MFEMQKSPCSSAFKFWLSALNQTWKEERKERVANALLHKRGKGRKVSSCVATSPLSPSGDFWGEFCTPCQICDAESRFVNQTIAKMTRYFCIQE